MEPTFKIMDETYATAVGKYSLSIRLSMDGFSFCILDIARNKYVALQTFAFQSCSDHNTLCTKIEEIVKKNGILMHKFKSVSAYLVLPVSTLVPNAIYEADKTKTYLEFNHPLEGNEIISSDHIKLIDTQNIFAVPRVIDALLKELFPSVKIHHYSTALIGGLLLQYKNQNEKKVVVHVQPSHFEIIVVEGGKLLFYNTFNHQTTEDFMYYLLFACEQLKLNPETLELVLIGEVEKNSTLYLILNKYVRNIRFGERNENYEYSYGFEDIPKHFYYNLLNQE